MEQRFCMAIQTVCLYLAVMLPMISSQWLKIDLILNLSQDKSWRILFLLSNKKQYVGLTQEGELDYTLY